MQTLLCVFVPQSCVYVRNVMDVRGRDGERDCAKGRNFQSNQVRRSMYLILEIVNAVRSAMIDKCVSKCDSSVSYFAYGDSDAFMSLTCEMPYVGKVREDTATCETGTRQINVRVVSCEDLGTRTWNMRRYEVTYAVIDRVGQSYLMRSFYIYGAAHVSDDGHTFGVHRVETQCA